MVSSEMDVLTYLKTSKLRICAFIMLYSAPVICNELESRYRIFVSISQTKYSEFASVCN